MEFDFEHLPSVVTDGPAIADNGEATAVAGPTPAAVPAAVYMPVKPLEEIAMLVRTLTYGDFVTMAAGLMQVRRIEPDFGMRLAFEQMLQSWANDPPADPPIALPSPKAASLPTPPFPTGEAALSAATGRSSRKSRSPRKQRSSPATSPGEGGNVAISRRDDAPPPASDATGVNPSAASPRSRPAVE